MKIRFSLLTFLICVSFVGIYFAGFRSGNNRGMHAVHELRHRIEVLAAIQHTDRSDSASNRLVQRSFLTNQGQTYKISGTELNELFVEVTPTRITDTATNLSSKIKTSTIKLKHVSVDDVKKQILETMPQLINKNLVAFDRVNNSITVKEGSPELLANIAALARFSDKRPTIYQAKLRIGKTMPDGSQVILYEPTVQTVGNLTAKFEIGDLNETISVNLRFDDLPLSRY